MKLSTFKIMVLYIAYVCSSAVKKVKEWFKQDAKCDGK